MASFLYESLHPQSQYYDRRSDLTEAEYKKRLEISTTVYVGNLHCSTSESALYELFARAGQITDLIMGVTKEGIFAGFCFVVYQTHEEARVAVEYLSQTKLYDRVIRVDWDYGFKEGRQYGRGIDGYQKRDQYRESNDAGRHNVHTQWKEQQKHYQERQSHSQNHNQHRGGGNRQNNHRDGVSREGGNNHEGGGGYRGRFYDRRDRSHGDRMFNHHNQQGQFAHNENKYKKNYTQYKNDQQRRQKKSQSPPAEDSTHKKRAQQNEDQGEE